MIIETKCGKIIGRQEDDILIFTGIPYAATKRFEKPEPYPPFMGYDASKKEEYACFQYGSFRAQKVGAEDFYSKEFYSEKTFTFEESPMRLNIIERKDADHDPVLIFVHGGGFETGTAGDLPYGESTEYARRGIILVNLSYRLNVFSLFESGNYGLQDILMGIRWVKENIASFGGDPEKIVLMGQSAGAMSIMDLLYTKKLEGLIRGAVTMSGGGMVPKIARPWTREESLPFWKRVMEKVDAKDEEEFRKLPADVIWDAWFETSRDPYDLHAVQPGIDGDVIPKIPQDAVKEGSYLDIPMIMGVTSQDFMPYLIYDMSYSWAKLHVKNNGSSVYGYFFDRELPGKRFKAFHGSDLWYMFGNMERSWRPFEKKDCDLKDQMINYVANFVKTLDPNGEGLPEWPSISSSNKGFRHFNGESEGLISPWKCRFKEYKSFLIDKGPM